MRAAPVMGVLDDLITTWVSALLSGVVALTRAVLLHQDPQRSSSGRKRR